MTRASPMVRSFNAGEFSELMEGRTDLDRYPASLRKLLNMIAAPQGPAISRSGTMLVVPASDNSAPSVIEPFIFSNEQAQVLELAADRIRFLNEDGIQIYDAVALTVADTTPDFVIDATGLDAEVDDDVVLGGFPANYNLNGEIARVTAKSGTEYTLSITWPTGLSTVAGNAARVYHIDLDFTEMERQALRIVQSVDVVYMLTGSIPRKLSRYGAYDWRIEPITFVDGPYLPVNETATTLTPSANGNAIPNMTSDSLPVGVASASSVRGAITKGDEFLGRTLEYALDASAAYYAFDTDDETYWASNAIQKGALKYDFGAAVSIDGYSIQAAIDNQDPTYTAKDYAPSTFTLEGSADDSTWIIIDQQKDYVLYDGNKSVFFKLREPVSYRYFRLKIKKLLRNGQIEPRVRRLVLRSTGRGAADALDVSGGTIRTNATSNTSEAFNGVTTVIYSSCTRKNAAPANSMYIGKTLATPAAILSAKVYGSSDRGFLDGSQLATITLYGKNGTAPANGTDGTAIGSIAFNDTSDERAGRTISSTNTTTKWEHVWVNVTQADNAEIRVAELKLNGWTGDNFITLTASSVVGINRDQGFLPTDVGRLVRAKGSDNYWRALRIDSYASSTSVTATLEGEPFPDLEPIKEWRLGYWSDTTGWPTCGDFFEDRLCLAGSVEYPDMFALSVTGLYEQFSQADETGAVLDDSAVVARLNARRLSGIRWVASDEKGLLIGTGSGEYLLSSVKGDVEALTPRNIRSRNSTSRGSADVEPVKIDRQVLYVQRTGRTLRELAFVFEADGYKSPSMSQLASHLGVKRFKELDYASEPHSIVWVRREDGSVVGLTYNRDENVIGWHRHDFSGGVVESLAVVPSSDQLQDALWLSVKRTVDGQDRRYIERLTRFWDFDMTVGDAHYVDSALVYDGDPTTIVYGLQHLEGEEVYGLADSKPVGPFTVENGSVTLEFEASKVLIGLGYDSEGETSRLENGAQDGTAIGKTGRIHNVSLMMWSSYGGEVGIWSNEDINPVTNREGVVKYEPIEYPQRADEINAVELISGEVGPFTMTPGYEKRNSISFRRPKRSTLPFNVTAIMPQMHKQDR